MYGLSTTDHEKHYKIVANDFKNLKIKDSLKRKMQHIFEVIDVGRWHTKQKRELYIYREEIEGYSHPRMKNNTLTSAAYHYFYKTG